MTVWKCLESVGDEFGIFQDEVTFDEAVQQCANEPVLGTLARVSSLEEYLFLFQMIFESEDLTQLWIGI